MANGSTVNDGFERYYAEKLWRLVPEVYRNEDATGAFRQLVELIADEVAVTRRSIDRLWEDQHIETSDDWAVPYIGALVGARLVSAQDRRARRVGVGTAIGTRRRRGTPDMLDTLVRAMSGWVVVLEEGFRRLARTRHRLDPPPRTEGIYTGTLSGGTADLRSPAGAELGDGPFTEYFHIFDPRLLTGRDGRFGIRKLNFHLYRLKAFEMVGVDPVLMTDPDGLGVLRTYTVDPSGRDIPLFLNGTGSDVDDKTQFTREHPICVEPLEWEITQAMRCRLLGHDAYRITTSHILELQDPVFSVPQNDIDALVLAANHRFETETAMRRRLRDFGMSPWVSPPDWYVRLVALSLIEATGKAKMYPEQIAIAAENAVIPTENIAAGNLSDPLCHPEIIGELADIIISPEQGRFASSPPDEPADFAPIVARYHYGFSGQVGAGPYPRPAIKPVARPEVQNGATPGVLSGTGLLFKDNRSYELTIDGNATVEEDAALTVGPQRRPFVLLRGDDAAITKPALVPAGPEQTFFIDGGWYAGQDPDETLAPGEPFDLVIEGDPNNTENIYDFERVEIRFATLDPGGVRADDTVIPPLRLFIRARIRTLMIRRSITGPIVVEKEDADDPSVIENLIVCESIVDASQTASQLAISNMFGQVRLEGSTVFGDLRAAVLRASDSIVDGQIQVVNNQAGCFRFSATRSDPDMRLPPRYRDYVGVISPAFFNSRRFGDPQYAQLSIVAPDAIATGAENGSEMGVFSHLLNPIRLNSVKAKVHEFGPVGQLAQYLFEGDRAAESLILLGPINPEPPPWDPPAPPDPGTVIPIPPPPPPPPLPTRCEDDPPDDDPEPIPDPEPEPEPEPDPQPEPTDPSIVIVRLVNADLNGAPDFWRGVDWMPGLTDMIATGAHPLPGIPFDKVDFLLEYDARLGTRPEAQSWKPSSPAIASRYKLARGSLAYRISGREPAYYVRQAGLETGLPDQVHAYANVLITDAPASRAREGGESFEIQFQVGTGTVDSVGMRAGWSRRPRTNGTLFHYVRLDNAGLLNTTSQQPYDHLLNTWLTVSLQADLRQNRALMSLAGAVDQVDLDAFGVGTDVQDQEDIRALFGFTRQSGRASGQIRNLVVSGPGRFIRVWLHSVAPSDEPVLRLGLTADAKGAGGRARITVHYEDKADRLHYALPKARADASVTFGAEVPGSVVTLDLPLKGVGDGRHLLLVVERDWMHAEDKLRTTVRLVSAHLLATGGRRQ